MRGSVLVTQAGYVTRERKKTQMTQEPLAAAQDGPSEVSVAALHNSDAFLDHLIAEIRKHINESGEPVTTPDIAVSMVGATLWSWRPIDQDEVVTAMGRTIVQVLGLDPDETEDLLGGLLLLIATALQRLSRQTQ
jgi:type III secretory pathway lipoprotein EscJ